MKLERTLPSRLATVLLLLLVSLCSVAMYYVWERYESSRAYRLFTEGDYEAVVRISDRLAWFSYKKEAVLELRAMAWAEIDPEQALPEMRRFLSKYSLKSHQNVTLRLAELLLDRGEVEEVKNLLEPFSHLSGANPRYMLLRARIQFFEGDYAEAHQTLLDVLRINPDHPEGNLSYAMFILNSNDPLNEVHAKVRLRIAAQTDGPTGKSALEAMATHPRIPLFPDDREWLAGRLREHPQADARARILAATQDLILGAGQSEEIIKQIIASEGTEDPSLIANWLLMLGASNQVIDFVTDGAGSALPLALNAEIRLNALLMQNDYEGVQRLLTEEEAQFPDLFRETILALADSILSPASANPTEQWMSAYNLAREEKNVKAVDTLGHIAKNKGWLDEALTASEWTLEESPDLEQTERALRRMAMIFNSRGESEKFLGVTRRLAQIRPNDPATLNNLFYLEALLQNPPHADPERFAQLVEKFPGGIAHSGYAFALWRVGKLERAVAQFSLLDQRFLEVPACRLTGALLAFDQQDIAQARQMLSGIDPSQLLPEEVQLLNDLAARLKD